MDAPSDDDIRTLVESARDEAVSEDRRRDLVSDCELWGSISSLDERLDVLLTRYACRLDSHYFPTCRNFT